MILWLRRMGIAAIAAVTIGVAVGIPVTAIQLLTGPIEPLRGLLGDAISLVTFIVWVWAVHRWYLVIERWDALRSGRTPQG